MIQKYVFTFELFVQVLHFHYRQNRPLTLTPPATSAPRASSPGPRPRPRRTRNYPRCSERIAQFLWDCPRRHLDLMVIVARWINSWCGNGPLQSTVPLPHRSVSYIPRFRPPKRKLDNYIVKRRVILSLPECGRADRRPRLDIYCAFVNWPLRVLSINFLHLSTGLLYHTGDQRRPTTSNVYIAISRLTGLSQRLVGLCSNKIIISLLLPKELW